MGGSPIAPWEFRGLGDHLRATVGFRHGEDPVANLERIRAERRDLALDIFRKLNLSAKSRGLDLGSGPGFIASELAPRIAELHCADVSASFLELARAECGHLPNVRFHHIPPGLLPDLEPGSLDFIFSHAVFIHLSFAEIKAYLAGAARLLKRGGRLHFGLVLSENRAAELGMGAQDPHGIRANSARRVLAAAWKVGLRPSYFWYGPNSTAEIILMNRELSPAKSLATYSRVVRARLEQRQDA